MKVCEGSINYTTTGNVQIIAEKWDNKYYAIIIAGLSDTWVIFVPENVWG